MEWKSRGKENDFKNLHNYMAKSRGIKDIKKYLNPPPNVVNSPLLLKNLKAAVEKVISGLRNNAKIVIVADPDP